MAHTRTVSVEQVADWFRKRHAFCTRYEEALAGLTRSETVVVERDESGKPTGRYYYSTNPPSDVVNGGKGSWRTLKVVCDHQEDGICGFTAPSAIIAPLYARFQGKTDSVAASGTVGVEAIPRPKAVAASVLAAKAEELSDPQPGTVCPECEETDTGKPTDKNALYMKCTKCGHTGTTVSFTTPAPTRDQSPIGSVEGRKPRSRKVVAERGERNNDNDNDSDASGAPDFTDDAIARALAALNATIDAASRTLEGK